MFSNGKQHFGFSWLCGPVCRHHNMVSSILWTWTGLLLGTSFIPFSNSWFGVFFFICLFFSLCFDAGDWTQGIITHVMCSTTELHLQTQAFHFHFKIYFVLVCTCVCAWCIHVCAHSYAGVYERLEARSTIMCPPLLFSTFSYTYNIIYIHILYI